MTMVRSCMKVLGLILFSVVVLGCDPPVRSDEPKQPSGPPVRMAGGEKWTLWGEYFEGCPCGVPCPCIFDLEADVDHCTVMGNYYIQGGTFEGVNLAGRNLVFVAFPVGRHMYRDKIDGAVYLDESTPMKDRGALEGLAMKVLDGSWYRNVHLRYVKIERTATETERSLVIPGIMELKVKALEGREGKVQRIQHNGMIGTVIVAPSVVNKYDDIDKSWSYTGKSGFIGPFGANEKRFRIGDEAEPVRPPDTPGGK